MTWRFSDIQASLLWPACDARVSFGAAALSASCMVSITNRSNFEAIPVVVGVVVVVVIITIFTTYYYCYHTVYLVRYPVDNDALSRTTSREHPSKV